MIWWWGYLHANGKIAVKRWFGDHADYTTDCDGNDFVKKVQKPFQALNKEKALEFLTNKLTKKEQL